MKKINISDFIYRESKRYKFIADENDQSKYKVYLDEIKVGHVIVDHSEKAYDFMKRIDE